MQHHYQELGETLEKTWIDCQQKVQRINQCVRVSHQTKQQAAKQIEQRTQKIKMAIEHRRQILARHIDQHIEKLQQM